MKTIIQNEFSSELQNLGAQVSHPEQGFFGPSSMTWTINEEALLLLGGMRALFMQIAHPKVAQAVSDHSRFREEPFKRLMRTFQTVHAIVFGTRDDAILAAEKIYAVHENVRANLDISHPSQIDTDYYANDPELLVWVFATLMDSAIVTYDLFFSELHQAEKEQAYEEGKLFAQLFGIKESQVPPNWVEFEGWLQEIIGSSTLQVSPVAHDIARSLLSGSALLWLLKPLNYTLAAGMLPPRLRNAFNLSWQPSVRHGYALTVRSIRLLGRVTPKRLRTLPISRRARARCQ